MMNDEEDDEYYGEEDEEDMTQKRDAVRVFSPE
jgi:hypothetical protein